MKLNNNIYDILKWISIIFLPAIGTLYCAVSGIWNIPYSEQVIGTIVAIETFIGAIIGISDYEYKKNKK